MDELKINFEQENPTQGVLVAKVLVNGKLLYEPDYAMDIHSFFSAIGPSPATVHFIGECGGGGCCDQWPQSFATWYCWQWQNYHFSWTNVRTVCDQLIAKIEALPAETRNFQGKMLIEELNFYRYKRSEIDKIEKLVPP